MGTEGNPIFLGDHNSGQSQSRGGRGGNTNRPQPQVYYYQSVDEPGPAHAERRFVDGRSQQYQEQRNQQYQDGRSQQHHYHGDQVYGRHQQFNADQQGHSYHDSTNARPHYTHGHCFICGKTHVAVFFFTFDTLSVYIAKMFFFSIFASLKCIKEYFKNLFRFRHIYATIEL